MYGFIIEGIRQAVLASHGLDVWKRLCTRLSATSGGGGKPLAAGESFQATSIYSEGMPIEIARAAAEVLGCSLDALLEACGEFYITVCVCLPSPPPAARLAAHHMQPDESNASLLVSFSFAPDLELHALCAALRAR